MSSTVKGLKSEIETILKSWGDQRKGKSFSGTAAVDFTKKVQPSLDLRGAIETNRLEFKSLLEQRRDADKASRTAITMLVAGIVSDESEGPDSEFLDTIRSHPSEQPQERADAQEEWQWKWQWPAPLNPEIQFNSKAESHRIRLFDFHGPVLVGTARRAVRIPVTTSALAARAPYRPR